MSASQPPPVPSAPPRSAESPLLVTRCRGWFDAVDACVLVGYRTGFVPSLTLNAAFLLLLALVVIRPDRPRPCAVMIEFGTGAESDLAMVELPAAVAEEFDQPDDAAPLPPEPAPSALEPVEIGAVEPAAFSIEDRVTDPDAAALLATVPAPVGGGRAGAAANAGGGGGGAGGIRGEIGRRLAAAGAGTGDVQISIAWNNVNDIDLHVMVEPIDWQPGARSIINFINRVGVAGGCLDVDRNVQPTTVTPVENVFWGRGLAPFGRYTVAVHHFRDWGGGALTEVEVVVLVDGEEQRFKVRLRPGTAVKRVTAFDRLPGGGYTAAPIGALPPEWRPPPPPPRPRPMARGFGPVWIAPMQPLK